MHLPSSPLQHTPKSLHLGSKAARLALPSFGTSEDDADQGARMNTTQHYNVPLPTKHAALLHAGTRAWPAKTHTALQCPAAHPTARHDTAWEEGGLGA